MKQFDERMVEVVKDLSFFLAGQPDHHARAVLDRLRSNLNVQLAGLLPETFVDHLVGAIAHRRLEIQNASHPSPGRMQ
jgi:hypothetical protein